MSVQPTSIAGVLVVHQPTHEDERGFFRQSAVMSELVEHLDRQPVWRQSNHARSRPDVLRGFHAEPWAKLVYVTSGRVLAVVADFRPDSPTFGEHATFELGDGTPRPRLFVPVGVGNAYLVTSTSPADYVYEVTNEWYPGVEKCDVRWDDPDIAVAWPVSNPLLSEADRVAPRLRERFPDHPRFSEEP